MGKYKNIWISLYITYTGQKQGFSNSDCQLQCGMQTYISSEQIMATAGLYSQHLHYMEMQLSSINYVLVFYLWIYYKSRYL
jgi:hypothetical protein